MANLEIRDGDGLEKRLKATGVGSDADPFIPEHKETSAAAILTAAQAIQAAVEILDNIVNGTQARVGVVDALPAGANAIGKVDIAPSGTIARAAVNLSASGNLVAAGTNKIKVLGMMLIADADLTVTIESGAAGADLIPAIPFAVDGNGFVLPMTTPGYHWIETASATALYATITGAGNLTGVVVYIDEA